MKADYEGRVMVADVRAGSNPRNIGERMMLYNGRKPVIQAGVIMAAPALPRIRPKRRRKR